MASHYSRQGGPHDNGTDITGILGSVAVAAASAVASAAGSGQGGGAVTSDGVVNSPRAGSPVSPVAGAPSDDSLGDHGGFDDFPGGYPNYEDQQYMMPPTPAHLLVICTVLYVAIFVMGLIGNTAVILVVLQCR